MVLASLWFVLSGAALYRQETYLAFAQLVYNDTKYEISEERMTYSGAESVCESRGGNLAKITEVLLPLLEVGPLTNYLRDNLGLFVECFWIGMDDLEEEGEWLWFDGTPVRVKRWEYQTGLLNTICDCGRVCSRSGYWVWSDAICTHKGRFLCQYDVSVDKSTREVGIVDTSTREITTMKTTDISVDTSTREITTVKTAGRPPRRGVPRNRRQSVEMSITKLSKKSAYMVGKPLSERKCSVVTMCSRICSTERQCVCFNYNTVTRQCQLFEIRYNVTYADGEDWAVWSNGACEFQDK